MVGTPLKNAQKNTPFRGCFAILWLKLSNILMECGNFNNNLLIQYVHINPERTWLDLHLLLCCLGLDSSLSSFLIRSLFTNSCSHPTDAIEISKARRLFMIFLLLFLRGWSERTTWTKQIKSTRSDHVGMLCQVLEKLSWYLWHLQNSRMVYMMHIFKRRQS